MEREIEDVAPRSQEVPMVEPEVVQQMRQLAKLGWGSKRISRTLGIARNTVKPFLRGALRLRCRNVPRRGGSTLWRAPRPYLSSREQRRATPSC